MRDPARESSDKKASRVLKDRGLEDTEQDGLDGFTRLLAFGGVGIALTGMLYACASYQPITDFLGNYFK